jgi:acyl-coenzyme A thioesterase PaaI-like protein
MDAATIGSVMEQIPYTRDLGLVIERVADGEVHVTLPDRSVTRNLAGTVHAGALFTFGETVAGLAAGVRTFEHAFPFARRAEIIYRRPAQGAVHGRARVEEAEVERVLAEIKGEGRSQLTVSVVLETPGGEAIAEMDVHYAFRPLRGN